MRQPLRLDEAYEPRCWAAYTRVCTCTRARARIYMGVRLRVLLLTDSIRSDHHALLNCPRSIIHRVDQGCRWNPVNAE